MYTFVPFLDIAIFLLVLGFARFILGDQRAEPWVKGLTAAQTVITIAAVVLAASFFVIEQPHASKLKMEIASAAAPETPGQAMIVSEVTLTNLGTSVINLKGAPMEILVQQVTPAPDAIAARDGATHDKGKFKGALIVERAENWGALAQGDDVLRFFLEAGESESMYYRVSVPCQPGLRLYVGARLTRPPTPTDWLFGIKDYQFRKQTLVDASAVCGKPGEKTP